MEKLAELDSVLAWVKWLQKEFSEADARVELLLHQEMTHKMPNGQQAYEPKWEIKIRLIAISHSVRQKDLNWWNEKSNQVKFFTTGKKGNKELLVNIYLPKIVHGRNLWYAGYGFTRVLLLALNIGSMGFFWWYDLSKNLFYEKITDIEEKAEFTINVANPLLQVDWENKSLQADSLSRIALCFEHLPGPDASTEEQKCYGEYFNALAFLAKSDMHLTYVINACDLFFRCLKSAMSFYGDLKGNTFAEAFNNFTQSFIPSSTDREWLITLSEKFQTERVADFSGITLDHILRVKLVCDAYFLNVFNRIDRKGDNKFK